MKWLALCALLCACECLPRIKSNRHLNELHVGAVCPIDKLERPL